MSRSTRQIKLNLMSSVISKATQILEHLGQNISRTVEAKTEATCDKVIAARIKNYQAIET